MRRASGIPGFNGPASLLKEIVLEMKKEPYKKVQVCG